MEEVVQDGELSQLGDHVVAALRLLKSKKKKGGGGYGDDEGVGVVEEMKDIDELKGELPNRVIVSARVRPLLLGEADRHVNDRLAVIADRRQRAVTVWLPPSSRFSQTPEKAKRKVFCFDSVFDASSTQAQVYQTVAAPLVSAVLDGVNGCLLAYGQTGAGKTFTTFGHQGVDESEADSARKLGLIPRAVHSLFEQLDRKVEDNRKRNRMESIRAGNSYSYAMYVTYYQIYLDSHIQDLLNPGKGQLHIRLMEDKDNISSHQVEGLSQHRVTSVSQVLDLLEKGDQNKVVTQTSMNSTSSRSHSIFTIQLVQHGSTMVLSTHPNKSSSAYTLRAKLSCVDLAGSERASRTHPKGLQLEEAKSINRSLSALGNVIAALGGKKVQRVDESGDHSVGDADNFVPWRDSKLTRVLQESLDGKAQVSLVVNIGPGALNVNESVNSLLFGRRSMSVSVQPKVNMLIDYEQLSKQLQLALDEANEQYQARIAEMEDQLLVRDTEMENLKLAMGGDNSIIHKMQAKIKKLEKELSQERSKSSKQKETHDLLEDALLDQLEINTAIEAKLRTYKNEQHDDELKRLKEKVISLSEEAHLASTLLEGEKQKVDELNLSIAEMDEEHGKTVASLKERNDSYQIEISKLTKELVELNTLLSEERNHVQAVTARVGHLEKELHQEQEDTQTQLEAYESQIGLLKQQVNAEAQNSPRNQKLEANMKEKLQAYKRELKNGKGELKKLREQVSRLTEENETFKRLENEPTAQEHGGQEKPIELAQAKQEITRLSERARSMEESRATCQQEHERSLKESHATISKLQSENAVLVQNFTTMTERLQSAETKLDTMMNLQHQERQLYASLLDMTNKHPESPRRLMRLSISSPTHKKSNHERVIDTTQEEGLQIKNALDRSREALA
eukprot:CAMPEP_0203756282 /NCGR_PEP_ID=MMETSP0098-20131031/9578_1 /ASSEMBLY_ACC=CAM_ASM_000208 /TAXON_ID=96639 /ORGANISM=" , Strain NY0313808BC1" /LENGTH=904 /DNA_ID=CAMNT_0050648087 /DNA_START=77 /DNA_END=2787 /DNA_ORIENTATION=-